MIRDMATIARAFAAQCQDKGCRTFEVVKFGKRKWAKLESATYNDTGRLSD